LLCSFLRFFSSRIRAIFHVSHLFVPPPFSNFSIFQHCLFVLLSPSPKGVASWFFSTVSTGPIAKWPLSWQHFMLQFSPGTF
jgi:hypothetical protein